MNYKILASGSSGNAIILENEILIDCGISFKKLENYYKNIKLVLLTHIHSDHFNKATIKKLANERPTLRFGCCGWLVKDLVECGVNIKNIDIYIFDSKYNYNKFQLMPLKLYHDVPQCGYRIFIDNKKVIYATDTKTLDGIEAEDYDLYLIEGNYEEEEIRERIKNKQIKGEYCNEYRTLETHLSKGKAIDFLLKNMNKKSEYVFMHQHIEK